MKFKIKSNKKKIIILTALGIVFVISIISNRNYSDDQTNIERSVEIRDETNLKSPKKCGAYIESFIHIDNNWTETNSTYDWCNGKGNENEPYIIENITINGHESRNCILIENSQTIHFIIRNCTVYNCSSGGGYAGIKMVNVKNGTLTNNNCSNNDGHGIYLIDCINNTLSFNIINDNQRNGIYLANSKKNRISNNTINYNSNDGINLYDYSDENVIKRNDIIDNTDEGLYIHSYCDDNVISENDIKINDDLGIYLYFYCDRNKILNNYIYDNGDSGIEIATWSDYNTVSNNRILYNDYQNIFIQGTSCYNNITDNIIGYSGWADGVWINDALCSDNNIYGNYFYGVDHGQDDGTSNNWDNGEYGNYWANYAGDDVDDDGIGDVPHPHVTGGSDPLPIWNDGIKENNITIDGMAKGVNAHNWSWASERFWCSGSGSYSDPYIITYYKIWPLIIDGQGTQSCISISNSTDYFVIEDAIFTNSGNPEAGISLYNTSNGKIYDTNCSNNLGTGIMLKQKCNNVSIILNLVERNGLNGISLDVCCYNNTIENNTIKGNNIQDIGIKIYSNCNNNTIKRNIIEKNVEKGIELYDNCQNNTIELNLIDGKNQQDIGLRLNLNCNENRIIKNNITKCDQRGIEINNNCDNNTFSNNRIFDNLNYGVFILNDTNDCDYNIFYLNYFENTNGLNAYDNGTNTRWDNGSIGNYWHDYTGCDSGKDGIGEKHYNIPGMGGGIDHYPLCDTECPPVKPTVPSTGGDGGRGDGDEAIPGYELYLMISTICIVLAILIKKRLKLKQ